MSEKKQVKPKIENISVEELLAQLASLKEEVKAQELKRDQLQQEVYRLQVERDIIEAASIVLKKEKGVNLEQFSNREKAEVINALRNKYQLNVLLEALKIAKSSYCYQNHILHSPDKYQSLRESVKKEFTQGYQSYGYRRIYSALKRQGIVISEKVIRRIMRQENLNVICKRKKKTRSLFASRPLIFHDTVDCSLNDFKFLICQFIKRYVYLSADCRFFCFLLRIEIFVNRDMEHSH